MKTSDKKAGSRIHFIGLGGIGMSGIARLYLSLGHSIQGSDVQKNETLAELEKMGANVFIGHDEAHVSGADRVVYSSSIPADHPERLAAARRGVSILHRSEALAELCRGKLTIAIAGTHGKTTTTAMVGLILEEAGRDPSVAVGAVVRQLGGNARLGLGPEMVIEADESDASFLNFLPDFAVITNIDREHMDHYGSMEDVERTFERFIGRLPEDGLWVGCAEDERVRRIAEKRIRPSRLYGFEKHDGRFWASDIRECPEGRRGSAFTVHFGDKRLGDARLKLIGRHNVLNALAAFTVADHLGIDFETAVRGLARFEGAGRRFDVRFESPDLWVVDDYAHHPTEIQKTLAGARRLNRRIFAVFQPHRYTRTQDLFAQFASSFGDADKLFITDIYAASETPRPGVSGESLARAVAGGGHKDTAYVPRRDVVERVLAEMRPGDLVITLGAGCITRASAEIAERLKDISKTDAPFASVRGTVRAAEPLSKHTTLKIGGPVDWWIEPEGEAALAAALAEAKRRGIAVRAFGAGSNLLAPDEGFRGAAISLNAAAFKRIVREGDLWSVGAGAPNTLFISAALEAGFGGFEFLSGIPGQIGGAVAMNAGSHGQSIDAFVESVRVVDFDGRARTLTRDEIGFRYRHSGIRSAVIVEARLRFPKAAPGAAQAKLEEYRAYRSATQDLWRASAGCLFKNPEIPGCSSGKLIDEAGLKGFRIGQAQISEKHANFLVNLGGATAADVHAVIDAVRARVKERSGIELQTEVEMIGGAPSKGAGAEALRGKTIAILAGGPSCERDVSIVSGRAVEEALTSLGIRALVVDPDIEGKFIAGLRAAGVDAAFLALHGTFGEDGTVQRMLEEAGIAYTGSGPEAAHLAFDKSLSQALFREKGLSIPEHRVLLSPDSGSAPFPLPVVVKPACAGSSVGVTIVREEAQYAPAVAEAFRWSGRVLVERFIAGRELTVGIVAGCALPVVEIAAAREFYDYQAKYKSSGTEYRVPAPLADETRERVQQLALSAYRALGCRVFARADVMLDAAGEPYLLEVNTIPGLTGRSLLPKAAGAAGIDFPALCVKILELSLTAFASK